MAIALCANGKDKLVAIKEYERWIKEAAELKQQENIVNYLIQLPRNAFSATEEKEFLEYLKNLTEIPTKKTPLLAMGSCEGEDHDSSP